jgi:hypothetical protein
LKELFPLKIRYRSLPALVLGALFLAAVSPAHASITAYVISGDPNNSFVPDQLSSLDFSNQVVTNIATLGDGSLGFNGGFTTGPSGVLYAIANDFSGASSLYSVQRNGTIALIGAQGGLGLGFLGGLTWDPAKSNFYAAALDPFGNTTLYSITTGGTATALVQTLPAGFSGVAYDSANSLFYGIATDNTGLSTLYDFSPGSSSTSLATLGFGFGALSYDSINNVLWAVSPVNNAGSQLYRISPAGVESGPLMTLGDGYVEFASAVPEPASWIELTLGLTALLAVGLRRAHVRNPKRAAQAN